MSRPLLAALLFVAAALAGCTGADTPTSLPPASNAFDPTILSAKVHKVLPPEAVWVTATDGTRLHNAVYRPDTEEKVPVFVNFSPYWGDTAMAEGDAFAKHMVAEYVPRGYAVVLSAIRGTGHSEGCFQIGGDLEVGDAYDVVDALSKMPWSSGAVAAGGKSYDSTTQNGLVAKKPHPALRGIFHVSGITDMYRYNAKDGVIYQNGLEFTPRYFVGQGLNEYGVVPPMVSAGSSQPDNESPDSLRRLVADAACPEAVEHILSGEGTAATGMRDAYWAERDWVSFLPQSGWNGSVFFVHGLQDWNVKPDHIDPWLRILQDKGNPVLGWLHQDTYSSSGGHVYPMRQDWNGTMLRWLDGILKGKDTHLAELWGYELQGTDDVWRHSASWPPAAMSHLTLSGSGESPVLVKADVKGEVPAGRLRVAGVPHAQVTVVPQHPDDIARVIVYDGPSGKVVTQAVRRLDLADDLRTPRAVQPGVPMTLNLTFYPMDHVLEPGQVWHLEFGGDPTGDTTPAGFFYRPEQVVGVEYTSVEVTMPVADVDTAVTPQPVPTKTCFVC